MILPADGFQTPLPIYSDVEIQTLQDPEYVVDGLIEDRALHGNYGPTGEGKTFVTMDVALCIATGLPFHGREVKQGNVAYVFAEGAPGLKYRVAAWKEEHGFGPDDLCGVYFIPTAVDLMDDAADGLDKLIETIRLAVPEPVRLVVIDTLAKCFGDKDENTTQHMNTFTNRCDKIKETFDCAVIVNHHTGWDEGRQRGNRSFSNNFDVVMACRMTNKVGQVITLKCEKQKDGHTFDDFRLRLVEVPIADRTTCVVRTLDQETAACSEGVLSKEALKQLRVLSDLGSDGATYKEWEKVAIGLGISKSSFKRVLEPLRDGEYATAPAEGQPKRGFKNRLTAKGRAAIGVQDGVDPKVPTEIHPSVSGPDQVQPQLPVEAPDKIGSNSGPKGSMDPSVGLGSGGGAYKAPLEPITPAVPTNGQPKACLYCSMPWPFTCGFCERTCTEQEVQRV